jgi:hypothetical protein
MALAAGTAQAQWSLEGGQGYGPYRSRWEQRVVRAPQEPSMAAATTRSGALDYGAPTSRVNHSLAGYRKLSSGEPTDEMLYSPEPIPAGELMMPGEPQGDIGYQYGAETCGCGGGDAGFEACSECGPCDFGIGQGIGGYVLRHISLFGGVHGFKGPVDQGRNGNFGTHQGVNFGAPVGGGLDWGYQLGFRAMQSNFSGYQTTGNRRGDRDQYFFTGGVFKRSPCGGMQWAIVYDVQHDSYYGRFDLQQIRQETSFVLPYGNEIGYMGFYGIDGDTWAESAENALWFDPTDMYAVFFRRQFELGGEGRLWGGLSGRGDGVLGAELRMPLGRGFAVENRFNYLIPKEGRSGDGQQRESWGMLFQLVWYPGRSAACEGQNCYRPIMNVADNATFMVTGRDR